MARRRVITSQAVRFGQAASLIGVVASPPADVPARPQGVVLLNAGVIHRVGPNRLHVLLARRLASVGFPTLRFDLSGVGDSDFRRDVHDLDGSVISDVDDALRFLRDRYGVGRFVLGGLCTGANHSLRFAARDRRVVGVIPIDPYAYRTRGFYARHYARRLFNATSWRNAVSGRNRYWRAMSRRHADDDALRQAFTGIGGTVSPPPRVEREEMRAILHELIGRGVPLLQVFTGGNIRYNHAGQFWAAFPEIPRGHGIDVEFLAGAGHTFERHRDRMALIGLIAAWLRRAAFPDTTGASRS